MRSAIGRPAAVTGGSCAVRWSCIGLSPREQSLRRSSRYGGGVAASTVAATHGAGRAAGGWRGQLPTKFATKFTTKFRRARSRCHEFASCIADCAGCGSRVGYQDRGAHGDCPVLRRRLPHSGRNFRGAEPAGRHDSAAPYRADGGRWRLGAEVRPGAQPSGSGVPDSAGCGGWLELARATNFKVGKRQTTANSADFAQVAAFAAMTVLGIPWPQPSHYLGIAVTSPPAGTTTDRASSVSGAKSNSPGQQTVPNAT